MSAVEASKSISWPGACKSKSPFSPFPRRAIASFHDFSFGGLNFENEKKNRQTKMNTGNESYTNMMSNGINTIEAGPSRTQSQEEHIIFLAIDISKSAPGGQIKNKKITEIGISTLATSDLLIDRACGGNYMEMDRSMKKIRTRNFRIKEWSNLQETDLVLGYGDNFKRELGNSEWISIHNAPKLIASCFGHDTFSNLATTARLDHFSSSATIDNNNYNVPPPTDESSHPVTVGKEGKKCNIIIVVGHRVEKKIADLKDIIGFDVTKLGNVIKAIDVQDMFRALQQNPKTRTLYSLFQELNKPIRTIPNPVSFFLLVARRNEKIEDVMSLFTVVVEGWILR